MNEQTPLLATQSDRALLQLYLDSGRHEAFAELVRRHQQAAYHMAFARTCNREQAEEAVQEAFLKLAGAQGPRALAQAGELRLWFLGLVSNVARDVMRSERRTKRRAHAAQFKDRMVAMNEEKTASEPNSLDSDTREVLTQAICTLEEEYRLPLVLHYLENLNQTEVAKLLGINQSNVARRISEALNQLRLRLQASGIGLGAVALPALLKAPNLLKAPASLQQALLHPNFLEAAVHSESIRTAASASQTAGGMKVAVSTLLILAAVGGIFAWNNAQEQRQAALPATSHEPAKSDAEPVVKNEDKPIQARWTFEKGPAADLKVLAGAWNWRRTADNRGEMVAPEEGSFVALPIEFPAHPALVTIKTTKDTMGLTTQGAYWMNGAKKLHETRQWRTTVQVPIQAYPHKYVISIYLISRYAIVQFNGQTSSVCEARTPYPSRSIAMCFSGMNIEEIEVHSLKAGESPAFLNDIPRHIKELGVEPGDYDDHGKTITPVEKK